MKRGIIWLAAAGTILGLSASAEVIITAPTGTPDESDVVLEAAVDTVRELPAETAAVVVDVVQYTADEVRNAAHGVASSFAEDPIQPTRQEMLNEVASTWDTEGEVLFRSYDVSPVIGEALLLGAAPKGAFQDVESFFSGVDFSEGASALYQEDCGRLLVRNTRVNLRRIEQVLASYKDGEDYSQIEVKAKFIEVSQGTLNQLGFDWSIGNYANGDAFPVGRKFKIPESQDLLSAGLRSAAAAFAGAPAAGSMVLSKDGWMPLSMAISALEQSTDSDVLSAPSITTKDGKKAEIWVGEDRQMPARFNVNAEAVNIRVEHTDWNSELLGVHFSVKPEVRKDNVIRLELNPKVVDLLGYDFYQVSPNASMLAINGYGLQYSRVNGRYPIVKYAGGTITDAWQGMSDSLSGILGFPVGGGDPNDFVTPPLTAEDLNDKVNGYAAASYGYFDQARRATHDEYGIPLSAVTGSLPYFRIREIKTTVDVADGSTVGLGGLIYDRLETYKDKVPVLGSIPLIGRLFRSEGERSIKRNLMIFVSATRVSDSGVRSVETASIK